MTMARRKPMRRVALRRNATQTVRHRRPTGFDPKTAKAILDRDDRTCTSCGATPPRARITVHHRVNRGMGGDRTVSTVVHGLAMCWPCNGLMEASPGRAEQAREAGWKLDRSQDPAQVPVLYPDGRRWLLTPDGSRRAA